MDKKILERAFEKFGIFAEVVNIIDGPIAIGFEVVIDEPKLSYVENLGRELALAVKANSEPIIRPIYSKGVVYIEFPKIERHTICASQLYRKAHPEEYDLPIVIGYNHVGDVIEFDLAKAPHVLIAGTTGSGKSVCLKSIITSIMLYQPLTSLILIDPKIVEFSPYKHLRSLWQPVVTNIKDILNTFSYIGNILDYRLNQFQQCGVTNIQQYRERGYTMNYIVVVIDELADIMMASEECERMLCLLAQKSRAVGIHFVVATQRPSREVVTGLIKANFPMRIAFKTASQIDSRIILDTIGAEKLIGKGDMLIKYSDKADIEHGQCVYVTEKEIEYAINKVNLLFSRISRLTKKGKGNKVSLRSLEPTYV